ncbi:MAG: 30S ribosome-binding factor RbfA [Clostridiales bacterium]|nr:30S ribosome-binding factor RbfA [Clostridiales bacterium]
MNGRVSRTDKLNGEFQKAIYEIITRRLNDPEITAMVSVLKVDTSKDLKNAKVFVSIYATSEEKKMTTFNAIKNNAKRIRYELSREMKTRTVPELFFILDGSIEYGDKMEKLFLSIKKEEENK